MHLVQVLAQATVAKIDGFTSQGISNIAWAFATVGRDDDQLFQALARTAIARIYSFNEQDLANTAWAFAKIGMHHPRLFQVLARAAVAKINSFTPHGISNTAWAFATVGRDDDELFQALARTAITKIDAFTFLGISNVAWAFSTVGMDDAQLFQLLARAAIAEIGAFNEQALANTAWAFAKMARADATLFDALARRSTANLHTFSDHSLNQLVWAIIQADVPPSVEKSNLITALKSHVTSTGRTPLQREIGPPLSQLERECADIISSMVDGSSTNRYYLGIELDVVIERGGLVINVEIDGPHHHSERQRRIDVRRDSFLHSFGVRVVRIDICHKHRSEIYAAIKGALQTAGLLADIAPETHLDPTISCQV